VKINHRPKLTPEEHSRLHARNDWRPALHCAAVFAAIAGIMVVYTRHPSIGLHMVCVFLVGSLQHQLSIVQHEANHYLLFTSRVVNEVVGTIAAGAIGFTMGYRRIHFEHHRALGAPSDPDLANYIEYPKTRTGFLADVAKNMSGYAATRQFVVQTFARGANVKGSKAEGAGFVWIVLLQAAIFGAFAASGHWYNYFFVWILPLVTVAKSLAQFRNIAEHTQVTDKGEVDSSRYRTIRCGWIEQFFFAPMYFNYHAEHHFFPGIPYYNLPAAHRVLREQSEYKRIVDVDYGYARFLLRKAIR
jgi:fatty acid desaturase